MATKYDVIVVGARCALAIPPPRELFGRVEAVPLHIQRYLHLFHRRRTSIRSLVGAP